jgi:uroporphyrinogen decarboxylase
MTSRERVLTCFARQEPDRVPVDYDANPGIDLRLKQHFGLAGDDHEGLLQALGVDFRRVRAPFVGPQRHAVIPGRSVDEWGIHRRWVEHESGGYWDYCDFPLQNATEEEVAAWPLPSPDDYDYSQIAGDCRRYDGYCVVAGGAGTGCIMNTSGFWRTMEQTFIDLITDDPAGLLLIDRFLEVQYQVMARTLEAGRGLFQVMWMGEDLSTQRSPMISMATFRKHIRPRQQRFVDLARSFGLHVALHTCGSSSWTYDDYAEMGVTVVDTLQPEAMNMSPRYLKEHVGHKLAFHGCISTAGPVAFGTVQEVVDNVRETLDIMMPGGGYALAPTHQLQDNSPTENVLVMYEAARTFGQYT